MLPSVQATFFILIVLNINLCSGDPNLNPKINCNFDHDCGHLGRCIEKQSVMCMMRGMIFLKALLAFLSFPIIAFSFQNLLWNSILEEEIIKSVDTEHVLS